MSGGNPPCRVYWGSHGCRLDFGHDGHHECGHGDDYVCCECVNHPDLDSGCVAKFPYYGPATRFYGEDSLPLHADKEGK